MTLKKRILKKRLAIMLLVLKVESINILVKVYYCAMKNKCLKKPYFQLSMMMKLKGSRHLEFYKNHFHKPHLTPAILKTTYAAYLEV